MAPRPEAKAIAVPSTIQEVFPNYHGLAWYWRSFKAPVSPDPEGRTLLRFWAVDYKADVWVNGKAVGGHEDGEEPFTLDVTDAIKSGAVNLLAIRVLNPTHERIDGIVLGETARGAKDLPHHPGMEWNFGGVLDSVELLVAPAVRIEDLYVVPDWTTGEIEVTAAIRNVGSRTAKVRFDLNVAPASGGASADEAVLAGTVPAGSSFLKGRLCVAQHRLWDLDDPFLYRVTARLLAEGSSWAHEESVRCGFRNFDFTDGYFRLNGRRLFLRGAHSVWTTPIKIHSCQDVGMLRRDIIYAKTMGFNLIRFLASAGARAQLDLCDELGMMVVQQSASSWCMGDSSAMPERFDRSLMGIVKRDRNHPCVALWYFLNENLGGAVFRHAVETLPKLREFDNSRLCLLNSSRWDRDSSVNSLSRPGSKTWDVDLADIHGYLPVPHRAAEFAWLRGGDGVWEINPADRAWLQEVDGNWQKGAVFLTEYGVASAVDLVSLVRHYEEVGATDKMDALYYRDLLEKFMADWRQLRLAEVFGRPEDYFKACLVANAEHRRLGMNAIRANPRLVGYSMTALHDEACCGEGPITFLRDLKPGAVDAIRTGFAPLKWCLFVEPWNVYRGGKVKAEVVLANEDVLRPGDYSVEVVLFDPHQTPVLRETVSLHIPDSKTELSLALPVWKKEVKLDGPAGRYRLTATFVSGAAAVDGEAVFQVSDPNLAPAIKTRVALWGDDPELEAWLKARGVACRPFASGASPEREVILTSGNRVVSRSLLEEFSRRVEQGATAVMLTPQVVQTNDSAHMPTRWTVFEKFDNNHAPEPETEQLTSIPETLQLGGQTGRRHEVEVGGDGGCQDLSPLWGGLDPLHRYIPMEISPVVYIYVPFEIRRGGRHVMKFDADFWCKAWLDGKAVSDTVSTSNERLVDLKEGAHLLVVKLVSGSGGCRLRLASWETDALARFHSPVLRRLDFVAGFYHRDDWARRHPIFDGLPTGLLDWASYRNIIPHNGLCMNDLGVPEEVVCGALQTSYGYQSGLYVAAYRHGAGRIVMNCLNIRENLGKDPVAERLLRNLLNYAHVDTPH